MDDNGRITVSLGQSLVESLDERAAALGVGRSECARRLLALALERSEVRQVMARAEANLRRVMVAMMQQAVVETCGVMQAEGRVLVSSEVEERLGLPMLPAFRRDRGKSASDADIDAVLPPSVVLAPEPDKVKALPAAGESVQASVVRRRPFKRAAGGTVDGEIAS